MINIEGLEYYCEVRGGKEKNCCNCDNNNVNIAVSQSTLFQVRFQLPSGVFCNSYIVSSEAN